MKEVDYSEALASTKLYVVTFQRQRGTWSCKFLSFHSGAFEKYFLREGATSQQQNEDHSMSRYCVNRSTEDGSRAAWQPYRVINQQG